MTTRLEIFKGQVAQLLQLAEGEQSLSYLLAHLAGAAVTDLQLAKIGMTQRQIHAQIANPVALRTGRVAGQVVQASQLQISAR